MLGLQKGFQLGLELLEGFRVGATGRVSVGLQLQGGFRVRVTRRVAVMVIVARRVQG